jgi:sugar phosphate isomerase/epimerase
MTDPSRVLLSTAALDPNRWGTLELGGDPTVQLSDWLDAVADAGFAGLELWDKHLTAASDAEMAAVLAHELPIAIFDSHASFDDADPTERDELARWATRSDCARVKFDVGADYDLQDAYAERIAAVIDQLPVTTAMLCECHEGISLAENPIVAAEIFDAAGPPERVQAIVHTHESSEHLRARFDRYGDRITHVHVNYLDFADGAPRLADIQHELHAKVTLLRSLGFTGTWTLEFVSGVMTEADTPDLLMEQAAADLRVLHEVLS